MRHLLFDLDRTIPWDLVTALSGFYPWITWVASVSLGDAQARDQSRWISKVADAKRDNPELNLAIRLDRATTRKIVGEDGQVVVSSLRRLGFQRMHLAESLGAENVVRRFADVDWVVPTDGAADRMILSGNQFLSCASDGPVNRRDLTEQHLLEIRYTDIDDFESVLQTCGDASIHVRGHQPFLVMLVCAQASAAYVLPEDHFDNSTTMTHRRRSQSSQDFF